MTEICKTCKKRFKSGVWLSPQFPGEKVLLFCSKKCQKQYVKKKLIRIKAKYPKYYQKLKDNSNLEVTKPFWLKEP